MGEEYVTLKINGEEKNYQKRTPYLDIAEEYQKDYQDDIVLVTIDNRLCELHKKADKDGELKFVTTADAAGRKAYRRSLTMTLPAIPLPTAAMMLPLPLASSRK